MSIYLQQLLLAAVVVYGVDVSGFTQSWRNALARWIGLASGEDLRPLPPFDCGKCATFWACNIFALAVGQFNLATLAFASLLSLLSDIISAAMLFIHESLGWLLDKITPR